MRMSDMKPNPLSDETRVIRLVQKILETHSAEMDCDTCNQQLDCLAELVAVGHDAKKLLPAVQAHLDCCADCREEFNALLAIIKGQQAGKC